MAAVFEALRGRLGLGRRAHPAGNTLSSFSGERWGLGEEWAPRKYGDYFSVSPIVYACVNLRARNLARVRLTAHTQQENGETTPVGASHPAQRLLDRPNPHWSRYRFWYMVEASLALYGSAPVAIFRDAAGVPTELWWLHPSGFRVVTHPSDYLQGYLYEQAGAPVAFRPEDVVWFRHPNPQAEHVGLAPVTPLRESIDTAVDAIRFNRRFFQNDATPGRVYIKVNEALTTPEAERIRVEWEEAFKGRSNAHRVAVLGNNAELKSLGIPPKDLEFVNGQVYTREEIAAVFGVSPILLGDLRFASLNNSQIAKAGFWDETMVPEMALIEAELNLVLMPQLGRRAPDRAGERLVTRFDMTQIGELREDAKAKAEREEVLVRTGLRTINELRDQDGLDPVPWGDDFHRRGAEDTEAMEGDHGGGRESNDQGAASGGVPGRGQAGRGG
jgi:HK97 family phage portal protein